MKTYKITAGTELPSGQTLKSTEHGIYEADLEYHRNKIRNCTPLGATSTIKVTEE